MTLSHSFVGILPRLQYYLYQAGLFCLAATAFFLPLSVTGTSISISTAAMCSLLSGEFFKKLNDIKKNPLCISILLIFIFAAISMFWGIAPWNERLSGLIKYEKLLYCIFLIPLCLEEKWRNRAINTFLIAMLLTVCISFLKQYAGLSFGKAPNDASWVFHSHIETSYFVAFSAYIFIYRIFFTRLSVKMNLLYSLLFLLFTWQEFFINDGRTGWSIYIALLILFFGQINLKYVLTKKTSSKGKWNLVWAFTKGIVQGALAAIITVLILYTFSNLVRTTINHAIYNYLFAGNEQTASENTVSQKTGSIDNIIFLEKNPTFDPQDAAVQNSRKKSIDYRLDFFKKSLMMAKDHPIIGVGPSGFKTAFYEIGGVPGWGTKLDHPHNEYLLSLVNFGMIGLLLLLYFFYIQWKISFTFIPNWPIGQALVLSLMLGCCYNALLYTTVTGHFYVFFLALIFCRSSCDYDSQDSRRVEVSDSKTLLKKRWV